MKGQISVIISPIISLGLADAIWSFWAWREESGMTGGCDWGGGNGGSGVVILRVRVTARVMVIVIVV